jgi:cardiolipin synthase
VLLVSLEAGLVGLVVVRDLLLVGGAFYKRASSLGWKVLLYICFFVIHQVYCGRFSIKLNVLYEFVLVEQLVRIC